MSQSHRYPPIVEPTSLLPWLLATLAPMNRTRVKELLRSGRVCVNDVPSTQHNHPLTVGDVVSVFRDAPNRGGLPIVYQDDAIIVIDKPSGLLTVATEGEKLDTAFVRLAEQLKTRPVVVHRIDRGTSGLLLFARSHSIRDRLQAHWDEVEKVYLAIVEGVPRHNAERDGRIESYLLEGANLRVRAFAEPRSGAQHAVSRYRVLSTRGRYSLVEVTIETGRKHQIRVHLAERGWPIVGDTEYGATTNPARRLGLHATRLAFAHPTAGARLILESPLPAELKSIV